MFLYYPIKKKKKKSKKTTQNKVFDNIKFSSRQNLYDKVLSHALNLNTYIIYTPNQFIKCKKCINNKMVII